MTYRAFQLGPKGYGTPREQITRIVRYAREVYGEPVEIRTGLIDETAREYLQQQFPDVSLVDVPRRGMAGNVWFGYEATLQTAGA